MDPAGASTPPAWTTEDVRIVNPDPEWATHAEHFAAEIRTLLGSWLSSPITHVGSTAVPGLVAKPIIDLQASAKDPAAAIAASHEAMGAARWFVVPRELDQRSWRWFVVRADDSDQHRLAHLHLMFVGEPRGQQQLAFRNTLRANPALAAEYGRLKVQAASEHTHDREAYARAKDEFVRHVLDQGP